MNKFCYWQIAVKEDFNKNKEQISWTCTAHLHEGRAMGCAYESLKDAKHRRYPCVDAKSPKKIKILKHERNLEKGTELIEYEIMDELLLKERRKKWSKLRYKGKYVERGKRKP